jgi:diguanylate cyclase (GGDEF)-like protein
MNGVREANDDRRFVARRRRDRRLRPSRREGLLVVVAIASGALIVAVALLALQVPDRAATTLEDRAFRGSTALENAHREMAATYQQFVTALVSPADQRAALVAESQRLGNLRDTYWHAYQRVAFGSTAERKLQQQYERVSKEIDAAGATVFGLADSTDTAAYLTAFNREHDLATERLMILEKIRTRFYTPRIRQGFADVESSLADTRTWILATFGAVVMLLLAGSTVLLRGTLHEEQVSAAREREHHRERRRADLETQLQRGLEMEPTEESTYDVILAALVTVRPDHPVELLVADSSRAHFRQAVSTDSPGAAPRCPVISPADCPAASSGQTRFFLSSGRLDACPFLRNRDDKALSAACVPVSIAGISTGVIHTTGPDNEIPDATELSELELVARKAGERIGYLRVLARSETQARIDVLTGLFNRRSLEEQARDVLEHGDQFVVAFADVDHFKDLNDKYGHEIGDRALRLFGRVLRDSVRPADIPARYGGEEFLVFLPDCTLTDARVVAERVRERLKSAVAGASVPAFTVSVGLAAWEPPETFSDTVARADAALLYAKHTGRDRVVASTEVPRAEDATPADGPARQPAHDDALGASDSVAE